MHKNPQFSVSLPLHSDSVENLDIQQVSKIFCFHLFLFLTLTMIKHCIYFLTVELQRKSAL